MIDEISDVTVKDIFSNINFYIDKFLTDGILFFKELNPTLDEQWDLMCTFGDLIGFVPDFSSGNVARSPFLSLENEDHKYTFERHEASPFGFPGNSDIFIEWHIENIHKQNPQIAASWNMLHFDCNPKSGTTGFVNMANFFDNLPEEWKLFLNKVKIKSTIDTGPNGVIIEKADALSGQERPIVVPHYKTQKPVLRMGFYQNENIIYSIDDRQPTKEEIDFYNKIEHFISDSVTSKSDVQSWITWSKGDLVMVDLFLMAHAVRGGFNMGERIFCRIWGYKEEPDEGGNFVV